MFVSRTVSAAHFIKHLPVCKPPPRLYLNFRATKFSLATCNLITHSHFDYLSSRQKSQVSLYVTALLEWNQKMNLTAVKDEEEIMERHIADSLAILSPIKSSYASHCADSSYDALNLVDVGTGAGLPGLILAIACPNWNVTLMESLNKRCTFLEYVVGVTGLTNVQVLRGRAEHFGQDVSFREVFDVAVARAVAEMRVLAEYCLPLVRKGGLFVAAKGHDPEEEVRNAEKAIELLGASVMQTCRGKVSCVRA